jgi:hypothetical protein
MKETIPTIRIEMEWLKIQTAHVLTEVAQSYTDQIEKEVEKAFSRFEDDLSERVKHMVDLEYYTITAKVMRDIVEKHATKMVIENLERSGFFKEENEQKD